MIKSCIKSFSLSLLIIAVPASSFASIPQYHEDQDKINLHTLKARLDEKGEPDFSGEDHKSIKVDVEDAISAVLSSFKNLVFINSILQSTINMHIQVDHSRDVFISLGRTPHIFYLSLKRLLELRNAKVDHLKSISFSGTPDIENMRPKSEDNQRRNIITEEGLACFESYLDQQGLASVKGTLWICDMIGTGGSLDSFLRILRHYYVVKNKVSMPCVKFFALNMPKVTCNLPLIFNESRSWFYTPKTQKLTLRPIKGISGFEQITVDCYGLAISYEVLDGLDGHGFAYNCCREVEYPAYRWTKSVQECAKEDGNGMHFDLLKATVDCLVESSFAQIKPDLEKYEARKKKK